MDGRRTAAACRWVCVVLLWIAFGFLANELAHLRREIDEIQRGIGNTKEFRYGDTREEVHGD